MATANQAIRNDVRDIEPDQKIVCVEWKSKLKSKKKEKIVEGESACAVWRPETSAGASL